MKYRACSLVATLVVALFAGVLHQPRVEAQELMLFPVLDCVAHDQAQETVTAQFGYINKESTSLNVPFGSNNIFMPAPFFRGQPTSYDPGIHHKVFSVTFPAASYAEWTLGSTTIRATNDPEMYCAQPQADVSITQTATPEPAVAGQELTYTLTAENRGPSRATGVEVRDALPGGVDLVSANTSQGSCSGTETVNCAVGALDADGSATVSVVVKPGNAGLLTNTASVSARELDAITLNNVSSSAVSVVAPPSASTGQAGDVTTLGATVGAFVNPNGAETTYRFEYGETDAYGQSTVEQSAGSGVGGDLVQSTIDGLRSGTTYHYRVVATNEHGTVRGADRTFTTGSMMLGRLTLSAKPALLKKGNSTTLSGILTEPTGVALASERVTLQRRPAGTGRFVTARTATTGANGRFAFGGIKPKKTTVYRVMFAGDEGLGLRTSFGPARRVVVRN
jgi:uncharacterized repeat protein (TIGR01451 family)